LGTFEDIYAGNYLKMFRIARKMVGDRDIASDIVQDVFICLFDKLNTGSAILHPNSWLYRATINKCMDDLRKRKRFQAIESVNEPAADDKANDNRETSAIIDRALSKLKPKEKSMVVLYSEGIPYKGIAEATGIRFSSIGKTLQRTLEKLEKDLKNQRYELYR
jgi:RNA polymerase sigma-70 factor, ECF subfamily